MNGVLINNNSLISSIVKCSMLIVIAIVALRHIVCFDIHIWDLLIFLFFVLFFIQLQGMGILQLMRFKVSNISIGITTGFFVGLAVVFFEYFLSVFVNTNIVFFLGCGLVLLISLFDLIRNKTAVHCSICKVQASFFMLVALVFLLSMLDVQLTFIRPEITEASSVYQDYLYHISLTNSISHDYPICNPDLYGEIVHYHFFSDLLCAIPVRLFGISSKTVLFDCMPYLNTYIVSISLYSFYRTATRNRKMTGVYSLLTICAYAGIPLYLGALVVENPFFSSLSLGDIPLYADASLLCHVVTNINAFGLGLSAVCCFISNYIEWEETKDVGKSFYVRLLILCVMITLVVGIKAPIGIVVVASLWGSYVLGFFFGKVNRNSVCVLIAVTICGLAVYYLTVGSSGGGGTELGLFFAEKAKALPIWGPMTAFFDSIGMPAIIRRGISGAVCLLMLFGVYCVVFAVAYLRELILVIRRKKPYHLSRVLVYAMIPVSVIVYETVIFPDYYSSETYFLFIAVAFVPVVTFWLIEELEWGKVWHSTILICLFALCSCVGVFSMGLFINTHQNQGIYNYESDNPYDIVTHAEYEGMCWIRDNTPADSLLAVDRYQRVSPDDYNYSIMHHNTFFGYSAYSQRNCYLEGSGYTLRLSRAEEISKWISNNEKLFDPSYKKRGELARQIGIDYVIVSKRLYQAKELDNKDYSLCFTNKDIDIYKITE